jgi:triacylglycerol lipase
MNLVLAHGYLIAHSMGGLDSRFMLSPANLDHLAAHVASLTTISTPHHGSP